MIDQISVLILILGIIIRQLCHKDIYNHIFAKVNQHVIIVVLKDNFVSGMENHVKLIVIMYITQSGMTTIKTAKTL